MPNRVTVIAVSKRVVVFIMVDQLPSKLKIYSHTDGAVICLRRVYQFGNYQDDLTDN